MRRVSVATIAAALLLAGCVGGGEGAQSPSPAADSGGSPSTPVVTELPLASAAPAPTPTAAGVATVQAWYVRESPRGIFVEPERRRLDEPTVGVARAALREAIEEQPRDPGLSTLAPAGTSVLDVRREDDVIVVDLSQEVAVAGAGSAQETAFAQQLAHTVTQFGGVESVRLLVEGEEVTDLWGHLDWSEPVAPDEFALSPIVIESPAQGERVRRGQVVVRGSANVFEATVQLRLVGPGGKVADRTFTTATCGTGCRGTWEHTFTTNRRGRWAVVAMEDDASDGEGTGPFVTERVFRVR